MNAHDIEHYKQRADEERDRATVAGEPYLADIHLDMASKYDELVARAIRGLPSEILLKGVAA